MKKLKRILFALLAVFVLIVGYVYYLTFTPNGRLDWGQALFLKLAGNNQKQIEALKQMTVQQRSHFLDAVPFNSEGLQIDTVEITDNELTSYIIKPKKVAKNSPVVVYFHGATFDIFFS